MNILKTLRSRVSTLAFPVLNWYKVGIFIVLFAAWTGFVHLKATQKCELLNEKQKTVQAEIKTKEIVRHVEVRLPQIQVIEVESAQLRGRVTSLTKKLEDAIYENKNHQNPSCDLSSAELGFLRELTAESLNATK